MAYVHIPATERQKLDAKRIKCVFVGYWLTQKAYHFWDPISKSIRISRDAIFEENQTSNTIIDNSKTFPPPSVMYRHQNTTAEEKYNILNMVADD